MATFSGMTTAMGAGGFSPKEMAKWEPAEASRYGVRIGRGSFSFFFMPSGSACPQNVRAPDS